MMLRQPVPHSEAQLYSLSQARVHGQASAYSTTDSSELNSDSSCWSSQSVSSINDVSKTEPETSKSLVPLDAKSKVNSAEINCSPNALSQTTTKQQTTPEFLDEADVIAAKKLLAKLCQAVVENTCHHARKVQALNDDRGVLQEAIRTTVISLNEDIDISDGNITEAFLKKLDALDEQMNAIEAVAVIFKELDVVENALNAMGSAIEIELDTIDLMKKNLEKQNHLMSKALELEEKSMKHKEVSEALDYGNIKMLRNALRETVRHYGTGETEYSIPSILAEMTSFQRDLDATRRFYENCMGLPIVNFNYINNLIEEVKEELSDDVGTFLREDNYGESGPFALSPPSSLVSERDDTTFSTFDCHSIISSRNALECALPTLTSSTTGISESLLSLSNDALNPNEELSAISSDRINSDPASIVTSLTGASSLKLNNATMMSDSIASNFENFASFGPISEKTALSNSLHTACSLVDTSLNTESSTIAI